MSELYGAPSGIIASDDNIRRNVLSGINAAKMMGEIGQQPAELAMKQAHARLYAAEAAGKEETARAQKAMLDLQTNFLKDQAEARARGQAVEQGKAQGRDATVADVPQGGFTNRSLAEPLEQFAEYAEKRGFGPMQLEKVYKDAAEIRQKEAVAAYRGQQAAGGKIDAARKQAEMVSQVTGTAAASPQGYMAMLSNPQMKALLPPGLTGNYATDKPILQAVTSAGVDTIKRLDLERKIAEDAVQAKRASAQNAASAASVRVADARVGVLKERKRILEKNLGEGDPATKEAKEALTAQRKAAAEAKFRKEYPPVPLDPKARVIGQNYVAADGKTLFIWEKDPVSGQPVARRLGLSKDQALARPAPKAAPVAAVDDDNEDDD